MITAATNIIVESFALAVALLLLLCSWLDKSPKTQMRFWMRAILLGNVALLAACIATWVLEGNARYAGLNTFLTAFANGLGFPMAGFYTEYVSCSIGTFTAPPKRFARIVEGLCALALALNFVSIFNGMYFSCPGGVYTRGPLFLLNQLFSVFILIPNAVIILKHRRVLGNGETAALLSFPALPLLVALTQFAVTGLTTMCLATTLTAIMIYVSAYLQRGRKLIEQENELTESRVSAMLSQIQPHFLYNSLEAVGYLCRVNPPLAEEMVTRFSMYLRGNMGSITNRGTIPFEQELEHTRNYLYLEKARFEERLNVVYDIESSNFRLPPLTLQPIVENAVRYGVTKREDGGTVAISARETSDAFVITVSDDGVGFDLSKPRDERAHIGISNVRERIAALMKGTLDIKSEPGVGTTATITIPKEA